MCLSKTAKLPPIPSQSSSPCTQRIAKIPRLEAPLLRRPSPQMTTKRDVLVHTASVVALILLLPPPHAQGFFFFSFRTFQRRILPLSNPAPCWRERQPLRTVLLESRSPRSYKREGCDESSLESTRRNPEMRGSENNNVGGYDPYEKIRTSEVNVGDPQIKLKEKERSVTAILKELAAIQQQGPRKYCILGTRHCSYLHQQIIELL